MNVLKNRMKVNRHITFDNPSTVADVRTSVNYNVQGWYPPGIQCSNRHSLYLMCLDRMSHPESIQNKDCGGDEEAGLANNEIFWKPSAGLDYRPLNLMQKYMGKDIMYPELRLDFSFGFSNNTLEKALDN